MAITVDDPRTEGLTVGAAAELLGVTVRTLHHWDEIGLASPSERTRAGYRQYTSADLDRLERVVAYRDGGLSLDAIRAVLDDAATEIASTLRAQRALVAERMRELRQLDGRLARLTAAHERGILLSDEEQREAFGDDWDPEQARAARYAWGGSAQWAQFAERSASRSRAEWQELSDAMHALQRALGDAMDRGVAPGDAEADALAERHRELFSNFFPITRRMQVCLARMFESDPGFAAHYEGVRAGLSRWFRAIVDASARAHGIDPDTATWE
ncbi:MerR family transcriptional regulator [Microbacterium karelineae]|uniref:MerR family transcriptional regulator n=1 Tax=Microbacterium karelineae TaxID=2654283 RepID=UPI0012EAB471|nr:MerR family transcriptional regulator [Microbacterium karelineae]